jgi:hypothetical protein
MSGSMRIITRRIRGSGAKLQADGFGDSWLLPCPPSPLHPASSESTVFSQQKKPSIAANSLYFPAATALAVYVLPEACASLSLGWRAGENHGFLTPVCGQGLARCGPCPFLLVEAAIAHCSVLTGAAHWFSTCFAVTVDKLAQRRLTRAKREPEQQRWLHVCSSKFELSRTANRNQILYSTGDH